MPIYAFVSCQDASSTRIAKRASSVGVGKLARRRISKRPAACAETERADLQVAQNVKHREIHPVWKPGPKIGQPETEIHVQIHELVLVVQEPQHDKGGQGRPECSRFYSGGQSICEVAVCKRILFIFRKGLQIGVVTRQSIRWYGLPEVYILENWTQLMLGEGMSLL